MKRRFAELCAQTSDLARIKKALVEEANAVHLEKRATDEAIGRFGAEFMPRDGRVMTQCNAGALATAGIGTALGVIQVAVEQGKKLHVLVPETRPYLQGARLTAWELHRSNIPLTLITDNMVGHFLKTGNVSAIVTGADRIAANGDTANKIGTYQSPFLLANTMFRFTSPRRFPRSTFRSRPANKFRLKSVLPRKSRRFRACASRPTCTPRIPHST